MSRWDCDAPLKSEWEFANRRGQEAGDYDLAIAEFNEAIRLKPDFVAPHANLGTIYVCRGEWEKAIAKFSEALRLKPDDFSFYYIRGNIYYLIGDYDKALVDYSAAIRLFKLSPKGVSKATGFSRSYVSRVLSCKDGFTGSHEFFRTLELKLGTVIDQRASQFFTIPAVSVQRARDVLDLVA
jgi:tetratricopeptide (TPR) repeat protein